MGWRVVVACREKGVAERRGEVRRGEVRRGKG